METEDVPRPVKHRTRLLTYDECKAWAEKYASTPWSMLALSTAADKAASPLLVMRSLLALAAALRGERERTAELEPYTRYVHLKGCAANSMIAPGENCDCGLDAALHVAKVSEPE